ncbi:helix-turn-helix domain-containing protein [Patulibacter sp. NPDC049589]|uniref:TetR/AcrR family transcriptional regulator n=1 Tax=Patulibacter sp. NPDC049589 TaxID=3154731 RepID=UPI003447CB63
MTAPEHPLRRDAARNVERVKAAAIDVFREVGLQAPLEEIARRAGVSVGTIYNRFGSREALIDAVVPDVAAAKLDAVRRTAMEGPDEWERLARYLEGLCALQAEDPALSDVIARAYPDGATALARVCSASIDHAATLIDEAHTAGVLRARFTAADLPALLIANRALVGAPQLDPEAWRRMLDIVLDGLRADFGRRPRRGR